ncbi:MAG: histidine--tRNA ligase [Candidatus Omnitrophica bacterium]|nr:histidine--tRNA ligase [Candidatus Omnitrophota bacterium]
MATRLEALGGASDVLPADTARWQAVEQTARQVLARYGFQEVRTPILEYAEVFLQSLGETTEVVQKQMYRFQDRGGREIVLRPEGTASAVRCYLEHGLDKTGGLVKWYYLGPMFRAERPQAGRRRQFHQLGVEVFGAASPYQDAEVLALLMHLLSALGLKQAALKINNLGCRNDRPRLIEQLRRSFTGRAAELCEECRARLTTNPLRILDCKRERCRTIAHGSVGSSDWLCEDCRRHVEAATAALTTLKVSYEPDPLLVRGLDYYSRTAFEVAHPGLGAQDALGGGGRYDDLVQQMGGSSPVPAVGFALGLERVLMALDAEQVAPAPVPAPSVFVAALGDAAQRKGMELLQRLREAGLTAAGEYEGRSFKRQMEQASKLGCPYVALLGDDEVANQTVTIRDMRQRAQAPVAWAQCVEELRRLTAGTGKDA